MRRVAFSPAIRDFKPCGIPRYALQEVYLPVEGLEAMRLIDLEGLDQAEAALRMGVSRQTLGRILAGARRTVTQALVEGLALRIETGADAVLEEPALSSGDGANKIAVSASGSTLDDAVDPRFGRAVGFLIVDAETMEVIHLANNVGQTARGVGIAAVETIAKAGARTLLTGIVGPKALHALASAGIRVYQNLDGLSAREAVERYRSGALAAAPPPACGRNKE